MPEFDLTIRNASVVTAADTFDADIGVDGGRVVALDLRLPPGRRDIDARGRLVMPGGVDSHCHVEQLASTGRVMADDFYSATVAAAFGGTTTIIPFAAQHRGNSIVESVNDAAKRAAEKSVIDYAFHLYLGDPTPHALKVELPQMVQRGITSLKVFMAGAYAIADYQMLDVLAAADRAGALTMVHAENDGVINWISGRLLERGHKEPKFHAVSHHPVAEAEAAHRVIQLASLIDVPVMIVHVASSEAVQTVRSARALGARVYGETCPQYLFLTATDSDKPGLEGAKWCCSPPLRDEAAQEALWRGLLDGTLDVLSSDHAPWRFDDTGKLPKGAQTTFNEIANGLPGIQARLPLLYSEGVGKGRITPNEFVALTSANHARMYGLFPRKGTIAVGSDADLVIWDTRREITITEAMMKDNVGYTPYEGMEITGWPDAVISRGRVVVEGGALQAERGWGEFVRCGVPEPICAPTGSGGAGAAIRDLRELIL